MFLHFSAKKVECAKHQWIHLVGDQPGSPHAFENFVVNARWRSTWVRVYKSLTLQSSYKPSMHFTMTCTTTHNVGPPGVLTVGTCSLRQSTNCLWKGGGGLGKLWCLLDRNRFLWPLRPKGGVPSEGCLRSHP